MICPNCGYMMSAFDKDCPRCHGKNAVNTNLARAAAPQPPNPKQMALNVKIFLAFINICLCGAIFQTFHDLELLNNKAQTTSPLDAQPTASTPASCGAMNSAECTWNNQAAAILSKSINIEKRNGESASVWNSKASAQIDQALSDCSRLQPVPPRCTRANSLVSQALISAKELFTYGASGTEGSFLTQEGAQQFDNTYNSMKNNTANLYGECGAEFQRLYNSPD